MKINATIPTGFIPFTAPAAGQDVATAPPAQTDAGDKVTIRSAFALGPEAFDTQENYDAYTSIVSRAGSEPAALASAHGELDAERVMRLINM